MHLKVRVQSTLKWNFFGMFSVILVCLGTLEFSGPVPVEWCPQSVNSEYHTIFIGGVKKLCWSWFRLSTLRRIGNDRSFYSRFSVFFSWSISCRSPLLFSSFDNPKFTCWSHDQAQWPCLLPEGSERSHYWSFSSQTTYPMINAPSGLPSRLDRLASIQPSNLDRIPAPINNVYKHSGHSLTIFSPFFFQYFR